MKVLFVNNFYKEGSTGKIVYDLKQVCEERDIDTIICYGRGKIKQNKKNKIYRLCSNKYAKFTKLLACISGMKFGSCFWQTSKLISIIKLERPDIVHLHCINDNIINIYKIINYLKKNKINTVLTLHAEFMYTANCGYSLECNKWINGCNKCPRWRAETSSFFIDRTHDSWEELKKSFSGFNGNLRVVSVSPWLMKRAKKSGILCDKKHSTILNGIDSKNIFKITENNLKNKYNLLDKKIILHVTASFSRPIKGGKYVIQLAKRLPDITFIIIGNSDNNIILPKNVIDIGVVSNQVELAKFYTIADLFVLTSEKETFCMPIAESLCCGTPVVGFKSGAPEEIAIEEFSSFVDFGDIDLLEIEVKKWLNKSIDRKKVSDIARKKYSKEQMGKEYIKIYEEMLGRN